MPATSKLNLKSHCSVPLLVPPKPRPAGSRAHVTLALAPNVPAVETGFDALRIVDAEMARRPDASQFPMPDGALLREILVPATPTKLGNGKYENIFYLQFDRHRPARISYSAFY